MTPTQPIAGMPDGVELVRIGAAKEGEYELIADATGVHIIQGPRAGAASGVIVSAAPGYSFRYDIRTLSFVAVKNLDRPATISVAARFSVSNEYDKALVEQKLEDLRKIPGFLELNKNEQ